jgi:hypothetical protein
MWLITLLSNNDDDDDNCHHINLNREQEEDCNIYVLKAYNSEPEEQELIKRGYVLHIPYKKKKGEEVDEENAKAIPNRKKHFPKRWVVERTDS